MAGVLTCLGAYLLLSALVGRTGWLAYQTWKGPRR